MDRLPEGGIAELILISVAMFATIIRMKHGTLRSIGHNLADSLASGCCLLIGVYDLNLNSEVQSVDGPIDIDFLAGTVIGVNPSPLLTEAVRRYRLALADLCISHGMTFDCFRHLSAKFWSADVEQYYTVTIEDQKGRRTLTDYSGIPGRRVRVLDHLGRLRPKSIAA